MNRHFAAIAATLILVQPIVATMAIAQPTGRTEQVHASVWMIGLLNIPIEIIVGIVLWLQIKQVPEQAIFPST